MWLCSPILSLIDTSFVGLLSGTNEQAALSPAVAVSDYAALALSFMFTATTNLIAGAKKVDTPDQNHDKSLEGNIENKQNKRPVDSLGSPSAEHILTSSLRLSWLIGTLAGLTLFLLSPRLIGLLVGTSSPLSVRSSAISYVRVRSLGFPPSVLIGSAQAACLALEDVRSPLVVLSIAASVNLFLDAILVGSKFTFINGAKGAAWATTASQYVAGALFLKYLVKPRHLDSEKAMIRKIKGIKRVEGKLAKMVGTKKGRSDKIDSTVDSTPDSDSSSPAKADAKAKVSPSSITRGFLFGSGLSPLSLFRPPSFRSCRLFFPYFLPVTLTLLGRISAYVAMSHVISSTMGPTNMAAQQIALSIFYTLTPLADSLNLTAQSYVPKADRDKAETLSGSRFLSSLTRKFLQSGVLIGSILSLLALCIPFMSPLFTTDPSVQRAVASLSPPIALAFLIHGIVCAGEGVLLGVKDFRFLALSYVAFTAILPPQILALKSIPNANPKDVWKIFTAYNWTRGILWSLRIWRINARNERENERKFGEERREAKKRQEVRVKRKGYMRGLPENTMEAGVTPELIRELLDM